MNDVDLVSESQVREHGLASRFYRIIRVDLSTSVIHTCLILEKFRFAVAVLKM